ncbi:MAG TPA: 4-alpha-glucanotransferase [Acidobacteriota bacterium]|nr:4-alpha-glucanotransferase [Acidobacteriota bacterium]
MQEDLNPLFGLARLYQIEASYFDGLGVHRTAPPETILAVLQSLGAPLEGLPEATACLRWRKDEIASQMIESVAVAWDDRPVQVPIRLGTEMGRTEILWNLELEDGSSAEGVVNAAELQFQEENSPTEMDRRTMPLTPVDRIPLGYHRLELQAGNRRESSLLISAPRRAYSGESDSGDLRRWGVFSPLYALRTGENWGVGDFSDLERLVEWTSSRGGSFVGSLPFFASFLDSPFDPSPYAPVSRLFWNEIFTRPEQADEWSVCEEARQLYQSANFQEELQQARQAERVDYRGAMRLKRKVLEVLARRFFESSSDGGEEYSRFLADRPDARHYAAFRAAVERTRTTPGRWPAPMREGKLAVSEYGAPGYQYHLYAQFLAHRQIRRLKARSEELACGLYMDLPLGAHTEGYDVWAFPEVFAQGVAGGAPPDDFFSSGQNWGFPPLNPLASRAEGHRYLRRCVANLMDRSHLLRIDHVMSLHRLFWIPDGFQASQGVYVQYPFEELYAVVTLESHRRRCAVVGEDLGTVLPMVRERMEEHGLLRMYVGQFKVHPNAEAATEPAPEGVVAALNTHDMLPFAAFWRGHDIALRREMGFLNDTEANALDEARRTLCGALMRYFSVEGNPDESEVQLEALRRWLFELASSPCRFLMINLEDLWLETKPQNVPGTGVESANWTRKHRHSFEDFCREGSILDTLEEVDIRRRRKEDANHEQ